MGEGIIDGQQASLAERELEYGAIFRDAHSRLQGESSAKMLELVADISRTMRNKITVNNYTSDPGLFTLIYFDGEQLDTHDSILELYSQLENYSNAFSRYKVDSLVLSPSSVSWAEAVQGHTLRNRRVTEDWGVGDGYAVGDFRVDLVKADVASDPTDFAFQARSSDKVVVRALPGRIALPGIDGLPNEGNLAAAKVMVDSVINLADLQSQAE